MTDTHIPSKCMRWAEIVPRDHHVAAFKLDVPDNVGRQPEDIEHWVNQDRIGYNVIKFGYHVAPCAYQKFHQ